MTQKELLFDFIQEVHPQTQSYNEIDAEGEFIYKSYYNFEPEDIGKLVKGIVELLDKYCIWFPGRVFPRPE